MVKSIFSLLLAGLALIDLNCIIKAGTDPVVTSPVEKKKEEIKKQAPGTPAVGIKIEEKKVQPAPTPKDKKDAVAKQVVELPVKEIKVEGKTVQPAPAPKDKKDAAAKQVVELPVKEVKVEGKTVQPAPTPKDKKDAVAKQVVELPVKEVRVEAQTVQPVPTLEEKKSLIIERVPGSPAVGAVEGPQVQPAPLAVEQAPTIIEEAAELPAQEAKVEGKQEQPVPAPEAKEEKAAAEESKVTEEKPAEPIAAEEIEGIDTVDIDIPEGNWLLKRLWWEKAKKKFNKIRLAVNQIADTPMKFIAQQSELEKSTLDPFYREIGLEQGELQEILKTLIDKISQERAKEGTLEFEERDTLKNLIDEQKNLEQLDKDVTAVTELDSKLDEALTLLLKQINQARTYESQAWDNFDGIAHELSDQKAQELYYNMDALLADIERIGVYIQKDFTEYFQKMVDKAVQQISDIKKSIEQLKKKGIDLKTQLEKLSVPSKKISDEKIAEKKQPVKEEQGWFRSFWNWIKGLFSSFWPK